MLVLLHFNLGSAIWIYFQEDSWKVWKSNNWNIRCSALNLRPSYITALFSECLRYTVQKRIKQNACKRKPAHLQKLSHSSLVKHILCIQKDLDLKSLTLPTERTVSNYCEKRLIMENCYWQHIRYQWQGVCGHHGVL